MRDANNKGASISPKIAIRIKRCLYGQLAAHHAAFSRYRQRLDPLKSTSPPCRAAVGIIIGTRRLLTPSGVATAASPPATNTPRRAASVRWPARSPCAENSAGSSPAKAIRLGRILFTDCGVIALRPSRPIDQCPEHRSLQRSPALRSAIRLAVRATARPRTRKSEKAVTADVLERLLATCASDRLADARDAALLLVAFASGGRRRSEVAGLRLEQLNEEAPVPADPSDPKSAALPCLSIRLGRTKTTEADADARVFLVGLRWTPCGMAVARPYFEGAGVPGD